MAHSISGYDIIGDIHGHAEELKALLQKMGYRLRDHVWRHPERKAIFAGDYIDRGPEIRQALYIVKSMTDAGAAYALLGNHEYNALAFTYHAPVGGYLRKHNAKNIIQHYETIKQFQDYDKEWDEYLAWFANRPLFFEQDGIRVVHACWDDQHISYLKTVASPLTKEVLLKSHEKHTDAWRAFDQVLKGKEIKLPDGHYFIDKDGNKRNKCRIKWWLKPDGLTMDQYLFHSPETTRHLKIPLEYQGEEGYAASEPMVFFGHYWLNGDQQPDFQVSNVCCLDYSVAKKGKLVAYRHYFDQQASRDNFVVVDAVG